MVKVITVKVIIHGSIILKMCFKLKFFQMFCSGIEQIACNCLGFWLRFLTVVSINEDVETYCCRFVEPSNQMVLKYRLETKCLLLFYRKFGNDLLFFIAKQSTRQV